MKNAEFVGLLTANCNKTSSVRCYSKVWPSGARRLPTYILYQIGRIVSFIQINIEKSVFCNPATEGILIYNVQPTMASETCKFLTIDALIVPRKKLDITWELVGTPFHLAVNLITLEIVNNTKSMLELELIEESEIESEGMEPAIVYGKLSDYEPNTVFLALASQDPVCPEDVFSGKFDDSPLVQRAPWFDSHVEARDYLRNTGLEHQLICELRGSKKDAPGLTKCISNFTTKTMASDLGDARGTSNPQGATEERIEDEIRLLLLSKMEEEKRESEVVTIAK